LPQQARIALKRDPLAIGRPDWIDVAITFKRQAGQVVADQVVDPDLALRFVDLSGYTLSIRRNSRKPIVVGRRGHRLLCPPSIHPYEFQRSGLNGTGNIHERSRGGKAVLQRQDAFHHGKSRARNGQPLRIERHGHQVSRLRIDQVPGGRKARDTYRRHPWDQVPSLTRPDRLDGNLSVKCRKQHGLAAGQELRTPVANLSLLETS
jgi:hypothetical protein